MIAYYCSAAVETSIDGLNPSDLFALSLSVVYIASSLDHFSTGSATQRRHGLCEQILT